MNTLRIEMEGLLEEFSKNYDALANITVRKSSEGFKSKMALADPALNQRDLEHHGSLLIDSILSQDEAAEVVSMLNRANEFEEGSGLPSFYTSSQMGGRNQARRSSSPPLSPIISGDTCGAPEKNYQLQDLLVPAEQYTHKGDQTTTDNGKETALKLKFNDFDTEVKGHAPGRFDYGDDDANLLGDGEDVTKLMTADTKREAAADPYSAEVGNQDEEGKHDLDQSGKNGDDVDDSMGGAGINVEPASGDEDTITEPDAYPDMKSVAAKLKMVDDLLLRLDDKSVRLDTAFSGLRTSLEFSQREIDDLKVENRSLKEKLEAFELEDRRTQFQVKAMDEKLDRLETVTKKKNLLLEGIPEQGGKKEDDKAVSDLFDQLKVDKGVNIEACFWVGSYNRSRDRPILVTRSKTTGI